MTAMAELGERAYAALKDENYECLVPADQAEHRENVIIARALEARYPDGVAPQLVDFLEDLCTTSSSEQPST